jgi:chromosome segregation ATPase
MEPAQIAAELARLQERTAHLQQTDERTISRLHTLEQRVDNNTRAVADSHHQLGLINQSLSSLGQRLEWAVGLATTAQEQLGSQQQAIRAAKVALGLLLIGAAVFGQVAGADRIGRALIGLP